MAPRGSDTAALLQKCLRFDAEDLEHNRRGVFSPKQARQLEELRAATAAARPWLWAFGLLGCLFMIGATVVGTWQAPLRGKLGAIGAASVPLLLLGVAFLLSWLRGPQPEPPLELCSTEGPVHCAVRHEIGLSRTTYEIEVGGRTFKLLDEQLHEAFVEGRHYRVFYLSYPAVLAPISAECLEPIAG